MTEFLQELTDLFTALLCIDLLIYVCNETLDDPNKNVLLRKIINNDTNAVKGNNNNNKLSNTSMKSFPTLSNQRRKFAQNALGNLKGSVLNKNNFSNLNNN